MNKRIHELKCTTNSNTKVYFNDDNTNDVVVLEP
jgi:hypothetical protein